MGNKVVDQCLLFVSFLKKEIVAFLKDGGGEKLKLGDSIDFDVEDDGQMKMFD